MAIGLLILRLVFGMTMLAHSVQKLFGWFGGGGIAGTAPFMEQLGFRSGRLQAVLAGLVEGSSGLFSGGGSLFTAGGRDDYLRHVGGHGNRPPAEGLLHAEWRLRVQPGASGGRTGPGFHRSGCAVSGRCRGDRLVWARVGCERACARAAGWRGAASDAEPRRGGASIRARRSVEATLNPCILPTSAHTRR